MDAADLAWLQTPAGRAVTTHAAALLASGDELRALRALGRDCTPHEARAAVALVLGRRALAGKLPDAGVLWCDREAAEQTSHLLVARHLAQRFASCRYVADFGAGMGGDALALAAFARVLAVDRDPARLAMVAANAATRGLTDRIETVEADLNDWESPAGLDGAWCDPARRDEGDRRLRPESWSPPLSRALALVRHAPGGGVKLAPGIDLDALPANAEVEFVSLGRGLRAAVAWVGTLARDARTATVLDEDGGAAVLTGDPDTGAGDARDPGAYLYDLDPTVGRAGLVERLAGDLGAWKLDDTIAYLSADEARTTPFARRYRVLAWLPFAERRLLDALRTHGAGRVEVTRRGSPVDTNALERRLQRALDGDVSQPPLVVALTRVRGQHVAIICTRDD